MELIPLEIMGANVAKIWNLLPNKCKSIVSLGDFKNIIKYRNGMSLSAQFVVLFIINLSILKFDTGLINEMHNAILCVCTILWFYMLL